MKTLILSILLISPLAFASSEHPEYYVLGEKMAVDVHNCINGYKSVGGRNAYSICQDLVARDYALKFSRHVLVRNTNDSKF